MLRLFLKNFLKKVDSKNMRCYTLAMNMNLNRNAFEYFYFYFYGFMKS